MGRKKKEMKPHKRWQWFIRIIFIANCICFLVFIAHYIPAWTGALDSGSDLALQLSLGFFFFTFVLPVAAVTLLIVLPYLFIKRPVGILKLFSILSLLFPLFLLFSFVYGFINTSIATLSSSQGKQTISQAEAERMIVTCRVTRIVVTDTITLHLKKNDLMGTTVQYNQSIVNNATENTATIDPQASINPYTLYNTVTSAEETCGPIQIDKQ